MATTLQTVTRLDVTECWCGLAFALPERLHRQCREHGNTFYCPLGHAIVYRKTDTDRLREELAAANRQRERAESDVRTAQLEREWAQNSARAYRGQVTRLKNRIAKGVCPCCRRSFVNLQRHMAGQHPGYADTPEEPVADAALAAGKGGAW